MRTKVRQSQRLAETHCLFCRGEFIDEEELLCQCGALYHQDCYETYGCGTIGCYGIAAKPNPITQLSSVITPAMAIDSRNKRLRLVSNLWLWGSTIIWFLAAILAISLWKATITMELMLLLGGAATSYVIGFIFHRKGLVEEKTEKEIT